MDFGDLVLDIHRRAQRVKEDEARIGVFSTGEFLAVALVLDRKDLLDGAGYTMLEAIERLGKEWFAAALEAQRMGLD